MVNEEIKVSIVVPVYNTAKQIPALPGILKY